MDTNMTQGTEQRLLGRLVAIDMTSDAASAQLGMAVMGAASTFTYTTIDGTREVDRADNGDQIP